jgi:DNA processing protein
VDRLTWATTAFERWRTPSDVRSALDRGATAAEAMEGLSEDARKRVETVVGRLRRAKVGAVLLGDAAYPTRLMALPQIPPVLFWMGNLKLLESPTVGMCGSREASPQGLDAARICGLEVARHGLTVVSGYARGVDIATHVGAIEAGGGTIIVLAEGILHFRTKKALKEIGANMGQMLVLSQFPPAQSWNAGAAMTRNSVIVGLGRALVVVEAREKGGTLDAGLQALRMRRPLLALDFSAGAPRGNELLFQRGAKRISSPGELKRVLDAVGEPAEQLMLNAPI